MDTMGGGGSGIMGDDAVTEWEDQQNSSAYVGEDGRHRKDHSATVPQDVYERVMEVS